MYVCVVLVCFALKVLSGVSSAVVSSEEVAGPAAADWGVLHGLSFPHQAFRGASATPFLE